MPTQELPKQYRPGEHESRIWERWLASGSFHADPSRVLGGQAAPYAILIPPPNVTDRLHLGHALNNTLQDILARRARMQGFETLWMPGTDHAGIATQAVVEKRVYAEEKKRRGDFTRDAFVARIQAFKDEYEAVITGQLQKMGCSCDWERQRFTMDDQCAKAVREAFFRLFRDGLIYRGKRLVNWDPALQTAVADDECFDEEVDSFFYYLRYPLVHKGGEKPQSVDDAVPVTWNELARRGYPGAEHQPGETQAWVTVATTRPETYLGDVAVAINPHDPRAAALRGLHVELPLVGRVIPILEDSYVVLPESMARTEEEKNDPKAKFATGFLKVTPAHDQNDYEIGQRHKAEIEGAGHAVLINVMAPDASISDTHGWTDVNDAKIFVGLTREDARAKVVAEFKSRGWLEAQRPYRHSIKHSDRTKAVVEPYLSDQWYVKVTDPRLAQAANRALAVEQRTRGSETESPSPSSSSIFGLCGTGVPPVHSSSDLLAPVGIGLSAYRRNLPHLQEGGSAYWVTFRTSSGKLTQAEQTIVLDACRHWHGERLELHAGVIMPDHVHLLFSPFEIAPGKWHSLAEILHSIKSFSAHAIAKHRGSPGPVWQDESFDRRIRSIEEFTEKLQYIAQNPVKEGLAAAWQDYPFLHVSDNARRGCLEFAARVRGEEMHRRDACATQTQEADYGHHAAPSSPGDGALRFHPDRYAKTFEQWHENIRDWCISRQLWWGHRIPVWSRPDWNHRESNEDWKAFGRQCSKWSGTGRICMRKAYAEMSFHELPENEVVDWREFWICVNDDHDLEIIQELERRGFVRDPDVLDTWFSSALWPLSTLGWPNDTPELAAFNPTSTLCTAREIITLWVSRMVMFNRYLRAMGNGEGAMGEENTPETVSSGPLPIAHAPLPSSGPVPFRDVFIHAVIQDGQGQKMSKSLGNGVDPLDIIASHGADAMRFTLCHMTTQTQDVRMPVDLVCPHTGDTFTPKYITTKDGYVVQAPIQESPRDKSKKMVTVYGVASGETKATPDMPLAKNTSAKFDLGRNFANKLWNAARFAMGILANAKGDAPATIDPRDLSLPDRWMLSRLHDAVTSADQALKSFEFSVYAQVVYDILWRDFCDWYLEAIKPSVAADPRQQRVLAAVLDAILRLHHPIMPFVTESIYEQVRSLPRAQIRGLTLREPGRDGLLCTAGWPLCDAALANADAAAEFERVRGLVTAIREVRATQNVHTKRQVTLHVPAARMDALRAHEALVAGLCQLGQVTTQRADGVSATFTFEAAEFGLSNLADAVDAGAEVERLTRQIEDLDKAIKTLGGRLSNESYVAKAPPKLVQETKDQLTKAMAEREAAAAALGRLAPSK